MQAGRKQRATVSKNGKRIVDVATDCCCSDKLIHTPTETVVEFQSDNSGSNVRTHREVKRCSHQGSHSPPSLYLFLKFYLAEEGFLRSADKYENMTPEISAINRLLLPSVYSMIFGQTPKVPKYP